jgi:hypothetical protein
MNVTPLRPNVPEPNRRQVMAGMAALAVAHRLSTSPQLLAADATLAAPRKSKDVRLGALRDLNSYFPFAPPASIEEWQRRAQDLREHLLVTCGLWPEPPRPAINATVHGDVEREGVRIQRVYFESSPGLFVTGSLFKPLEDDAKPRAAILSPHGHWANGRFYDAGDAQVKKEIAAGAEKYEKGGRYPLQARCMQLARMGCIVFHYDMIGYADSAPLTYEVAHRFAKQRPDLSAPHRFGLFSAPSESRLLNVLGLQTWNSMRAVDWLLSRDDVDADRIGVTGASGGGTQSFMLAAVDQRVAAAFPAVMVSTAMQGGCTCENASYFRTRTGNIEIAALCAPRPLGLTGANDWTVDIETKGLPELRKLYGMFGASEKLTGKYNAFPHNYNAVSRAMMYDFFNNHFSLGHEEIQELDFEPLSREELTVWNEAHPKPNCDVTAEIDLLQSLSDASDQQLATLIPTDRTSSERYQHVMRRAVKSLIGMSMPSGGTRVEKISTTALEGPLDGITRTLAWLRYDKDGFEIPLMTLTPNGRVSRTVLWVAGGGKQSLLSGDGKPTEPVMRLLKSGARVVGIDTLSTGWHLDGDQAPPTQTRRVDNPREFAGYTYGYNDPLFSQRTQDILVAVAHLSQDLAGKQGAVDLGAVDLVGVEGAGPWVAAAAAICPAVSRVCVDTQGFRFASISDVRDPQLLPGAVKYGDLPGILSSLAPRRLLIAGENGRVPEVIARAFEALGIGERATSIAATGAKAHSRFADWLSQDE